MGKDLVEYLMELDCFNCGLEFIPNPFPWRMTLFIPGLIHVYYMFMKENMELVVYQ